MTTPRFILASLLMLAICPLTTASAEPAVHSDASSKESMTAPGSIATTDSTASGRASMSTTDDAHPAQLIRESNDLLRRFTTGTNRRISAAGIQKAQCIAVFPQVIKGALIVGGRSGDGVASCRTAKGWSDLAFLDLTGASLGAQLGADATDVVMLMMTPQAKDKLITGRLTFGADASAVAGERDSGIAVDSNQSNVVVISERSGLFAGAALDGTMISADEGQARVFYKKARPLSDILNGDASNPSPESRAFAELLDAK